jgi:CheY-like chemotaxis protein
VPVRVLIVDDNADITALLGLQIDRTEGFEVVGTASNGVEAIEMAASVNPDVILLDMMMPVMGGLEALPYLRQNVPGCRIFVFSAAAVTQERERALELGADAYYVKGDGLDMLDTLADLESATPASP